MLFSRNAAKNRSKAEAPVLDLTAIEEKMTALQSEIDELGETIKAKKAELKQLAKDKLAAEEAAIAKKAEEDKKAILDAVAASGKSVEEILELLK
jgi:hypothetical protein